MPQSEQRRSNLGRFGSGPGVRARWLVVVLALIAASPVWASPDAEPERVLIPLQYRAAEPLLPLVRHLLAPGEEVSVSPRGLYVDARPETLGRVREAVDAWDHPPRALHVQVRRGEQRVVQRQIPPGPDGRVTRRHATASRDRIREFVAMEGRQVTLTDEESWTYLRPPMVPSYPGGLPPLAIRVPIESRALAMRAQVLPGDDVWLEIRYLEIDSAGPSGGTTRRYVDTVHRGSRGEWIRVLGPVSLETADRPSVTATRRGEVAPTLDVRVDWRD